MAASAKTRSQQAGSGSDGQTIFGELESAFEFGTTAFRTSDLNVSDSDLRKAKDPIHIAHVAFDLPNKLGRQYSWVLLLAPSHGKFLSPAHKVRCASDRLRFLAAFNELAADTLQHYVWRRLEHIFSDFTDVGHLFLEVDADQPNCATLLWEAILKLFPLDSALMTHLQLAQCVKRAIKGPSAPTSDGVQVWFNNMAELRRQFYADPNFSLDHLLASLMLESLASSDDRSLHAASVKIKAQLELQHEESPSDVQIDLPTMRAPQMFRLTFQPSGALQSFKSNRVTHLAILRSLLLLLLSVGAPAPSRGAFMSASVARSIARFIY